MEQSRHTELDRLTARLAACVEQFVEERLSSDYRLHLRNADAHSVVGTLKGPRGMRVACSIEISYFGGNIYHLRVHIGEEAQRTFSVCLPKPTQKMSDLQTRLSDLCSYLLRELYCEAGKRLLEGRRAAS